MKSKKIKKKNNHISIYQTNCLIVCDMCINFFTKLTERRKEKGKDEDITGATGDGGRMGT